MEEAKKRYDMHTRPLKPIQIGTSVRIQDHSSRLWDKRGIVISVEKKQGLPDSIAVWPNVLAKPQIHPVKYDDNTASKEHRGRSANGKRFGRYNRRVKKETPT